MEQLRAELANQAGQADRFADVIVAIRNKFAIHDGSDETLVHLLVDKFCKQPAEQAGAVGGIPPYKKCPDGSYVTYDRDCPGEKRATQQAATTGPVGDNGIKQAVDSRSLSPAPAAPKFELTNSQKAF